MLDKTDITR